MTISINTQKSSENLKPQISKRKLSQNSKNDSKSLKFPQQVSLVWSMLGALISLISQQYAVFPLSLSLIFILQINRRSQLLQATEQKHEIEFVEMQQRNFELENRLEQLTNTINQPQENPQYLTKTHLTPITAKLRQLQRENKAVELMTHELKELQQQLKDLQNSNSQLLAQIQHKLNSNRWHHTAKSDEQEPQRVAIFVDAANIYHTAKELGIKQIDYAKLKAFFAAKYKVNRALFYTAVDPANKKEQLFLSQIKGQGFQIVSKNLVRRKDGSMKGNLDLELGLDLVKTDTYDKAILVSGDGDFICAVKHSQSCGKQVEVASFRSHTSVALIEVADSFLDLQTIQDQIC